jgi:APA family basic amino acid/polyamine antiporter
MERHLQKELNVFDLICIGVGGVIGSGIFVLFASILKRSGNYAFLALLLAAIPNIITALSYAELSTMYKSNGMEYDSIRDAFGDTIASISVYILIAFIVFNAGTVLLFAGKVMHLTDYHFIISLVILIILALLNYYGIKVSKSVTTTVGIIEITALLLISLLTISLWQLKTMSLFPSTLISTKQSSPALMSFFIASFLGLFLYNGYDGVVKMTEETFQPEDKIPKGMIGTIIVVTIIYLSLAVTATSLPIKNKIQNSPTPISEIYKYIFKSETAGTIITLIGIIIIINTVFVSCISLSRFGYSLSKEDKLPKFLSDINDRFKTPHNAVLAVFVLIALVLLIENGEKSAMFANIFFLLFMVLIMSSVIILRYKKPDAIRKYKVPLNIGNIPVLPLIGVIICAFYLYVATCCFKVL